MCCARHVWLPLNDKPKIAEIVTFLHKLKCIKQ